MDAKKLQHEIKKLIAEMGWTQATVARHVFYEISDSDNDDEIRRYVESFKKKLSRPTTPAEHLNEILRILCEKRDVQKIGKIKPNYVPGPSLDPDLLKKMRKISQSFDQEEEDELSSAEDETEK